MAYCKNSLYNTIFFETVSRKENISLVAWNMSEIFIEDEAVIDIEYDLLGILL